MNKVLHQKHIGDMSEERGVEGSKTRTWAKISGFPEFRILTLTFHRNTEADYYSIPFIFSSP